MAPIRSTLLIAALMVLGCGDDGAAPAPDASAEVDASGGLDAAARPDTGAAMDAAGSDTGPPRDDGGPPPDAGPPPAVVDPSTLEGKLVMGYQGWFGAPGDGSRSDRWRHWSRGATPAAGNLTFDAWPDLTELAADELHATDLRFADGSVAGLYSAYDRRTVDHHFRWMRETGVDGVMLQEFVVELGEGTASREFRDGVTDNVRASAEAHGRVFAIMYDISGSDPAWLTDRIQSHWRAVVDSGLVGSSRYLQHGGRPLVAVWGFGFDDRAGSPAQAQALIDWWRSDAAPAYRATVLGGVPTHWRTLTGDSSTDPAWAAVYRSYDIISPWTVGRYADDDGVRRFRRDLVEPDLAEAGRAGADYLPVVWPGFSWANLMPAESLNQIPRRGGQFWWTQLHEFNQAGATMIYGAMFDEVDEGTAMFKVAPTAADAPSTGRFLTLDADGYALPSDFYLRLAAEGARVLRGERAPSPDRPIRGGTPTCSPPDSMAVEDRCVPSCGAAGGDSCDPAVCAGLPPLDAFDCAICCDSTP